MPLSKVQIAEKADIMRFHMTKPEARLWKSLQKLGLKYHKFKAQVVMFNYIVDFVCGAPKVIIEVDGNHHYNDPAQVEYDKRRDAVFNSKGYTVIRFKNEEIMRDLVTVLNRISQYVRLNKGKLRNYIRKATLTKSGGHSRCRKVRTDNLVSTQKPKQVIIKRHDGCETRLK